MDFINWCNNNQGFLSFLLSCSTLITSIVAIILSLINYINEYRKRFSIYSIILIDGSKSNNLRINIVNTGNKPLGIQHVDILFKKCHLTCNCQSNYQSKVLMPSESISLSFDLDFDYIKSFIDNHNYEDFTKYFNIYATDSNGKKHYCKTIYPAI